jgi:ubiquitin-activating enzyme E1
MKSEVATEAICKINKEFNVISMQDRVAPETEDIFNDRFWESLDVICNALDNQKTREYTDQKCVYYHKPLLESGSFHIYNYE